MNHTRVNLLIVGLIMIAIVGLVLYSAGSSNKSLAQEPEKSLEIRRHAQEPLELIDLKIRDQSLKSRIKVKERRGEDGADNVIFQEENDWPKRMRIRLRNVSGKAIVGFQAYLYFKPPAGGILFSVTLKGTSTSLERAVLQPGDEIEAIVDEGSWDRAVDRIRQYGTDINLASVSLSVEIVAFGDGLQWHRGNILRQDPVNPNKRIPIETKRPPGNHPIQSLQSLPDGSVSAEFHEG